MSLIVEVHVSYRTYGPYHVSPCFCELCSHWANVFFSWPIKGKCWYGHRLYGFPRHSQTKAENSKCVHMWILVVSISVPERICLSELSSKWKETPPNSKEVHTQQLCKAWVKRRNRWRTSMVPHIPISPFVNERQEHPSRGPRVDLLADLQEGFWLWLASDHFSTLAEYFILIWLICVWNYNLFIPMLVPWSAAVSY